MKRAVILLSLGVFLAVSCEKKEQEPQVSDVSFTPCQQSILKSDSLSDKVDVEFTNNGVKITHYNFAVTCDFTTVDVTHTFVNGVLNITQQGSPNQANCICYTDVSYTINGISQNEVNVIFINGVQVYCHNNIDWTNKTWELREHNKNKVSITEGIWGTLVKTEGNCMPPIDENSCKQFPIMREIVVYEYTTFEEAIPSSDSFVFFEKVNTKLVATTTSDIEGFFQIKLKPGKYSVFVKENQLLWANLFDGYGGISPVIVESSKISEIELDVDYGACY
jgi:hypothetical protein